MSKNDINYYKLATKGILFNTRMVKALKENKFLRDWIALWDSTTSDEFKYETNPFVFKITFEILKKA